MTTLLKTDLGTTPLIGRGKVRDLYAVGDALLMVATDRISAFDHVLGTGIPGKGKILTQISLVLVRPGAGHRAESPDCDRGCRISRGRCTSMQTARGPVDAGEARADVSRGVRGAGIHRGVGMEGIQGDRNRLRDQAAARACRTDRDCRSRCLLHRPRARTERTTRTFRSRPSNKLWARMRRRSCGGLTLAIYEKAGKHAESRGLILADTKFEFGRTQDGIVLADEVLTPDSSRFWEARRWKPGGAQPSFDKQFVRDYLESIQWNKQAPAPSLPDDVAQRTLEKYLEAFRRLTGGDT